MRAKIEKAWRIHLRPGEDSFEGAARRVTHLGIGAHQDDLEFMACHGILAGLEPGCAFGAVVCTDGAGSIRTGPLAGIEPAELVRRREEEQEQAARLGNYVLTVQMRRSSRSVRPPPSAGFVRSLACLLQHLQPRVIYTHNPADRHPTHVGVVLGVIAALRTLPPHRRPARLLGCEVWGDLDWLPAPHRVVLDVSRKPCLTRSLARVFTSQISAGKRYDLAVAGRRRAHATFADPHAADTSQAVTLAMDLTPLLRRPRRPVRTFLQRLLSDFQQATLHRLHG